MPRTIVSDRDPIFLSQFWEEFFQLQGSSLCRSSAYHPQTDGQTEVVNRSLEGYLRCFAGHQPSTWTNWLPWAEWWYNTTFHSAIQLTPFEAVYGRPPLESNLICLAQLMFILLTWLSTIRILFYVFLKIIWKLPSHE